MVEFLIAMQKILNRFAIGFELIIRENRVRQFYAEFHQTNVSNNLVIYKIFN